MQKPILDYFIVLNASPTILLAKIDFLKYLPALFSRIFIPKEVYEEVIKKLTEETQLVQRLIAAKRFQIVEVNQNAFKVIQQTIPTQLGKGELAVLTLVHQIKEKEQRAVIAAIDDKPARNLARTLNIDIVGTLGLLLAKKEKLISKQEAKNYLKLLVTVGGYFDPILIEYIKTELER